MDLQQLRMTLRSSLIWLILRRVRNGVRQVREAVWNGALQSLPLHAALRLEFLRNHWRLPRLQRPETFNEKIIHRKLCDRDSRLPRLSDKIRVKEYVAEVLGAGWTIPTLWCGKTLPPRHERNWPIPYVLKANHGSGWNIFVLGQRDQDWDRIEKTAGRWMRTDFGKKLREWAYTLIDRKLLVEPFMGQAGTPPDYKVFVFGGRATFVQVDLGRLHKHRQFFYDTDWNRLPFRYVCPFDPEDIERPQSLAKMIWASERLVADFPFVRVDFYEIDGKPYVGELTFYPNSGGISFKPRSVELQLGRLWPDSNSIHDSITPDR